MVWVTRKVRSAIPEREDYGSIATASGLVEVGRRVKENDVWLLRRLPPLVPVMQAAETRHGNNPSVRTGSRFDGPASWCVAAQRAVATVGVVIRDVVPN